MTAPEAKKPVSKLGVAAVIFIVGGWIFMRLDCGRSSSGTTTAPSAPAWKKVPAKVIEQANGDTVRPPATAQVGEPGPARPALKGSRAAFRAWFQKLGIEFKPSPLADGTARELGHTGAMIVEAIGYRDALERASFTFGLSKDDPAGLMTVTGALMVFMRETGWENGHTWVISTLKKPKGGTTSKNGVDYHVVPIMAGMYTLSAKPAGTKDD